MIHLPQLNGYINISKDRLGIKVKEGLLRSTPITANANISFLERDLPLNINISSQGPLKDHVNFLGTEKIDTLNKKRSRYSKYRRTNQI